MPGLFPRLDLSPDVRRTFRFHMAYALLDAACGGLLLNAPFVALRAIDAQNWHLPLRDVCAGIGTLASLYLGSWMARRRKMPFVFVPGVFAAFSALAMAAALALGSPFWFLLFFGVGGMFEIVTRPAIAAILRQNYPVAQRATITATVRQWSSFSFVITIMLAATLLWWAGDRAALVAGVEIVCAATLGISGFFCFRKILVHEQIDRLRSDFRLEVFKNVRESVAVVLRDGRYRRYLIGCFLECFFGMLYLSMISALLSRTLKLDYLWCAALKDGIPTLMAFAATGLLGRWFDRANPWVSWWWVRLAIGLDALLLAMTPQAAMLLPAMVFLLPVLGRILRGSVQGGWWILWWQIGITHFAPPGENTSRYAGISVFLYGVVRIVASLVAMTMAKCGVQPETFLWIGGLGVIASGLYSLRQAIRERKERRPATFAEFEAQFEGRS